MYICDSGLSSFPVRKDTYFGWIAEYGLQSDVLPPRYQMHMDANTGRTLAGTSGEVIMCVRVVF